MTDANTDTTADATADATAGLHAAATAGTRLRDVLGVPGRFATIAELVPWRGALGDVAGTRARQLATELAENPRIDALSITDNAGGHAMLSPEVLAADLVAAGQRAIVHVACRDRNRNELLSLGWRLASAGIEDLLVLSGDYPTEGYLGVARPVFDIDSVALLHLYSRMNEGALEGRVVARPIARDGDREIAPLKPARGAGAPAATDFFMGAAVSPFKTVERDQVPQYLKLEMKVRNGAQYAITQVGWDMRKLDELRRWVTDRGVQVALLANVFVLTRGSARVLASGDIAGVVLPPALLEAAEREGGSPDKGKAFFLDLAARQVAIARGLGYAGAYIGGASTADDVARVIEMADGYTRADWREIVGSTTFAVPGTWYAYRPDRTAGLNESTPVGLTARGKGPGGGAPIDYRIDRLLHDLVFSPTSPAAPTAARLYEAAEKRHLGRALHVLEQAVKGPLFDCRDCGDCSLPDIAYLCPESQCVKNQRNGPCGGSTAGDCEIPGKPCIWARAYERLAPYGEATTMLERPAVICDNALRRTSAWGNTFLGRDHATRPPIGDGGAAGRG
ncbi:MAG TPA: methylenetetrahydrofolate reductase C-terminal domain-containing protein [Candidatus Limnocylindrales bacterium]